MSLGLYPRTSRHIHATPWTSESVKEKISSVSDKVGYVSQARDFKCIPEFSEQVNKKVGQGLASAIETSEKAMEKTKETLGE